MNVFPGRRYKRRDGTVTQKLKPYPTMTGACFDEETGFIYSRLDDDGHKVLIKKDHPHDLMEEVNETT